jgi:putative membrane protein
MQVGNRYTFLQTAKWTRKYILLFVVLDSIPVILYQAFHLDWMYIPWEPLSLIGIAVAFYLGFKNNSSYERVWEARKIWGGIVNASRSFTVMARDMINNDNALEPLDQASLDALRRTVVHRHVAWLRALTFEMRILKTWEHNEPNDVHARKVLGTEYHEERFNDLKPFLSQEEHAYMLSKGNRSSHLLSMQAKHLMELRRAGLIEHFRHLRMQDMITELFNLQGQSERIKNFPFPRQYATINYFFVVLFLILLPFGMIDVFVGMGYEWWIWLAIPFSAVCSWVFWMMEMIGEVSENPFEGLYNDVPITDIATRVEIDIRQMLDEPDLPEPAPPFGDLKVVI